MIYIQGRSQELEMRGAKLGEGSGGRLRPKGGAHAPVAPPLATALQLTPLDCIYFINDLVII